MVVTYRVGRLLVDRHPAPVHVAPPLPPSAWGVNDVVAWARKARLSEDSVQALIMNQVDGPTLVTLDKTELQSELGIRSLAARRYLWDLIEALRCEQDAADYFVAVQMHELEIKSLERELDVQSPDMASGGKSRDTVAVLESLHNDAARQRQIVQDHIVAHQLQRELAGSQQVYEDLEAASAEQYRLEQLSAQSEFDHRYAATLQGRREAVVPEDPTVRDPTLFRMCVDSCVENQIDVAERLKSLFITRAPNSVSVRASTATLQEAAVVTDAEEEDASNAIGNLRYIKRCSVCDEEDVRGFRLGCSHDYCVACMRRTLKRVMNDFSLLPFRCCEIPIDMECARILLKRKDADRLFAKIEENKAKNKMFCPRCSRFINLDLLDTSSVIVVPCACGTWLCASCKTAAHSGRSCRENQAAVTGSNELVLDMARQQGWKQCPKCQTMIEHVSGCNHMTCSNCTHEFCFQCLSHWSVSNGVSLCSSGSCEVWSEDMLVQAGEARVRAEDDRLGRVLAPAAREVLLQHAMLGLRQNEGCQHEWTRSGRGYSGECERCGFEMVAYCMTCRGGCGSRVCYTCAHHRIPQRGWR